MDIVTNSTIPLKLHPLILSFYTTDSSRDTLNYVIVKKCTLGTISLVCKRWANIIRPGLFAELTLRDYHDADALSKFVRDPKSQISNYIRQLACENKLSCTERANEPRVTGPCDHEPSATENQAIHPISNRPWIHLVCLMGRRKLSSLDSIRVHTTGPFPGAQPLHVLHSIHPFHEQINSAGITSLTLNDLHFPSFRNILRQLRHIPLRTLECTDVTWEDDFVPEETSILWKFAASGDRGGTADYTMTKSSNNAAVAWIAIILARSRESRLLPQDGHALFHVANAILRNGQSDTNTPDAAVHATRGVDRITFSAEVRTGDTTRYISPAMTAHLTHSTVAEAAIPEGNDSPATTETRSGMCVRAISMLFHAGSPLAPIEHGCDWAAFDQRAASFANLETVVCGFESQDDLHLFCETVLPSLNELRGRDSVRLVCAVRRARDLTWRLCGLDPSEQNQGSLDRYEDWDSLLRALLQETSQAKV